MKIKIANSINCLVKVVQCINLFKVVQNAHELKKNVKPKYLRILTKLD